VLRVIGGLMYLAGGADHGMERLMTIRGYERDEAPIPGSEPAMQPAE
jgi:cytochrome c oxidase cbb3-type subunit 1